MSIIFEPTSHSYTSITPEITPVKWTSVTTLVGQFKQPFEPGTVASRVAKSRRSKWFGMTSDDIQKAWKKESDRACSLGNYYHDQREKDLLECHTIHRAGFELPVIAPLYDPKGRKMASSQQLQDGIYPEHLVYLRSAGICGQSDLVEVYNGKVYITDYKTNKEIKSESYKNWEGTSQKMNHPLTHLDDCNLMHYTLQLSIYLYMILKHNPNLSPGELTIHHISFEEEDDKDEHGFPISKLDADGNPIIKEINMHKLSYLKDEVHTMLMWYKENKDTLKKK